MRTLLVAINAKYIHSNLAIHSLRAFAKEFAEQIDIAEYTINHVIDHMLRDIYKKAPDILMFSCYIWNISYVKALIPEINKIMPNVPIWLGGPEVSYASEEILRQLPIVKGIVIGEGEKVFRNLMTVYNKDPNQRNFRDIEGIVYTEQGTIIANQAEELLDLKEIPFTYRDIDDFNHRIIYYESSRGCPYHCSYCLSSVVKGLRFKHIETVKEELGVLLDKNVPQIKFVDRTFNCKKEHAMAIWQFILDNDNGNTNFHFEVSADLLDEDELALLQKMRPGLIQLEIGVQSTNKCTVSAVRRTMNFEKLGECVTKIKSFGNIHQHLDLIAGLPYEDYDSFIQSFHDVYALNPEQLQLGFLKVLYGSQMYTDADAFGIVYKDNPPYEVLYNKWLSYAEILKLKSVEEMLEIYYNSGQFRNTIAYLERQFATPFELYEKLAEFYTKSNLADKKHSRINRYELLLEFADSYTNRQQTTIYKDLLMLDLYLRENMKSRPKFARDVSKYKDLINKLRKEHQRERAQNVHIEIFGRNIDRLINDGIDDAVQTLILFDYSERNPLTYEAKWRILWTSM